MEEQNPPSAPGSGEAPASLEPLVDKDIEITRRALEKVKIIAPEPSYIHRQAQDFLEMARSYYSDGEGAGLRQLRPRMAGCRGSAGILRGLRRRPALHPVGVGSVHTDNRLFTLSE